MPIRVLIRGIPPMHLITFLNALLSTILLIQVREIIIQLCSFLFSLVIRICSGADNNYAVLLWLM